ncbi:MAG: glycosyltransferase [Cyclobacteriaceae bacterium]|nr:glycosyltransferase [Cyclobacteriaceae bacterium]
MTSHKRKKIVIVKSAMGQGGAERVASILLHYLDRTKYEVSLLLMKSEGEYLKSLPADVKVTSANVTSLWFFVPPILRFIKKESPDVVFSIDGGTNIPLAIASFLSPFRKWRSVLSERNILFPPGKSRAKRLTMVITKFLFYRFANQLTAVSEGVRKDMKKWLLVPEQKVRIVYNPMVEPSIAAQANETVDHPWFVTDRTIPVIVHAGRFVYQKDHTSLIQAFQLLNHTVPCRLFLLGEGPLMSSIQNMIREDLKDRVHFAGFDINPFKYFSKCDLFVLSSLHEGMPGVLIQAMACGAPSVSTNCPSGPDEIIDRPGENGLLVPVKDSVALAAAMEQVLTNPSLALKLREQGLLAVQKFRVEEAISSYISAIER